MTTLDVLRAAYQDARCEALTQAPLSVRAGYCRFGCGRRWQFTVSQLGGHALCAVTPGFLSLLDETLQRNPGLSLSSVALALGVNRRIVRVWWEATRNQTPYLLRTG